MKIHPSFTFRFILLISSLLFIANTCKESIHPPDEDGMVTLQELPDIPGYDTLTLERITWKLIGFGNHKTQQVRLAVPENCGGCYTFLLDENRLKGYTQVNVFRSEYIIDTLNNNIIYTSYIFFTEVGEFHDGEKFLKSFIVCTYFMFTQKGLILYSPEKNSFLLFKPYI